MLEKKVYVLGDDGCGKSALLHALTGTEVRTDSPTAHNTSMRRTTQVEVVAEVGKKRVRFCPCFRFGPIRMSTKEEKLVLDFMECVEKEARVRAINYLDTDVVLLCFDISTFTSLENLRKIWLPEVKYYCPDDVPILLAGLKMDQTKPREKEPLTRKASSFFRTRKLDPTQREVQKLTKEENIYDYIQCSAKDARGIEELKNALSQAATTVTSRSKNSSPSMGGVKS